MQWAMTSASGREQFACARVCGSEDSPSGIFEISISGSFWHRGEPIQSASMALDFHVRLPQVLLSESGMAALRAHLSHWLEGQDTFECVISPARNCDQVLTVALGTDPGLICSRDKPAFIVSYSRGAAMVGRWAFIVDQSCIRNYLEGSEQSRGPGLAL